MEWHTNYGISFLCGKWREWKIHKNTHTDKRYAHIVRCSSIDRSSLCVFAQFFFFFIETFNSFIYINFIIYSLRRENKWLCLNINSTLNHVESRFGRVAYEISTSKCIRLYSKHQKLNIIMEQKGRICVCAEEEGNCERDSEQAREKGRQKE